MWEGLRLAWLAYLNGEVWLEIMHRARLPLVAFEFKKMISLAVDQKLLSTSNLTLHIFWLRIEVLGFLKHTIGLLKLYIVVQLVTVTCCSEIAWIYIFWL